MAGQDRSAAPAVTEALERAPYEFDFFQALRRLECLHRDKPRLGAGARPSDEPVRLGQEPSLAFTGSALASFSRAPRGGPPRLSVSFLGMLGPNGPLPLHLTEYARDRLRNAGDPTFVRFLDLFHHRMLSLFYRAWASGQPTVSYDRPDADRFGTYVGALLGLGMRSLRERDAIPDRAKLYYAGWFSAQTRSADGLRSLITDFFGMPAEIEEFVGEWVDLPDSCRWRLGTPARIGILGGNAILGARAWQAHHKFRIVLGPLDHDQYRRLLPGGDRFPRLAALVRNYVGDELNWDARLVLDKRLDQPLRLGRISRLGWTSWLGRCPDGMGREDLVLAASPSPTRESDHV